MSKHEEKLIKKANQDFCTLVVGSCVYDGREDRRRLYKDAYGIDMVEGEGVDEVLDITSTIDVSYFHHNTDSLISHIDCHSVLEHCQNPKKAAENMTWLLVNGGTIFLSVPFVWREHAYPNDYFRFTKEGIKLLFPDIEWDTMWYICGGKRVTKPPSILHEGVPYFGRTELYCFGRKE